MTFQSGLTSSSPPGLVWRRQGFLYGEFTSTGSVLTSTWSVLTSTGSVLTSTGTRRNRVDLVHESNDTPSFLRYFLRAFCTIYVAPNRITVLDWWVLIFYIVWYTFIYRADQYIPMSHRTHHVAVAYTFFHLAFIMLLTDLISTYEDLISKWWYLISSLVHLCSMIDHALVV